MNIKQSSFSQHNHKTKKHRVVLFAFMVEVAHPTRTTFKRLDKALCYKGLSNVSEKAIFERKCILNPADCYETFLIKILKKQ
jgi:hypothetical protein